MSGAVPNIAELPKTDLHLHLDGAIRTRTILDLAGEQNYKLPVESEEELNKIVRVSAQCNSLSEFLSTFNVYYPLLQTPTALARIAAELVEDLHKQNVIYAEIRFAPILAIPTDTAKSDRLAQMKIRAEKIARSFLDAKAKTGMAGGLIFCCMREFDSDHAHETVELFEEINNAFDQKPIVGIDLAGDESRFTNEEFAPAFQKAAKKNINITIHAAEAAGPESALKALDLFGAKRIGHGVKIREDQKLLDRIISEKIALEICLTSNIQTGTVKSYQDHPLKFYHEGGVVTTINTDDPAVSDIDINHEWEKAIEHYNLNTGDVYQILSNAITSAFCTESVKAEQTAKLDAYFSDLAT